MAEHALDHEAAARLAAEHRHAMEQAVATPTVEASAQPSASQTVQPSPSPALPAPSSGDGKVVGIGDLRGAADTGTVAAGAVEVEANPTAQVREGVPDVDGSLEPGVISKEVRKRLGAVLSCYERALKRRPKLSGKIVVSFTIGSTGSVTDAEMASDTLGDAEVSSCVIANVKRWRFPAPDGGSVTVEYPLIFTP